MKFGKVRGNVSGREGKNNNASPVIFDDKLLKRRLSFGPNKFSGDAVPAKHALFRDSSGPKIKEKRPYFGDDTRNAYRCSASHRGKRDTDCREFWRLVERFRNQLEIMLDRQWV